MPPQEFTEAEIQQLHHEHLHNPYAMVRIGCEVIYLKALDFPDPDIERITRLPPETIHSYLTRYQAGRIQELEKWCRREVQDPGSVSHDPDPDDEEDAEFDELAEPGSVPLKVRGARSRSRPSLPSPPPLMELPKSSYQKASLAAFSRLMGLVLLALAVAGVVFLLAKYQFFWEKHDNYGGEGVDRVFLKFEPREPEGSSASPSEQE